MAWRRGRCNVSPLRGEKPQNRPLSKLNTGRFALRVMLLVKTKTETRQWQTGYSPRPPTSSHQNEILHGGWPSDGSLGFECPRNRLSGFGAVGGRSLPIPIDLAIGSYNSLYYRTSCDLPFESSACCCIQSYIGLDRNKSLAINHN